MTFCFIRTYKSRCRILRRSTRTNKTFIGTYGRIFFMKNNLIKKVLIIAIPTYIIAFLTNAMVFTMPMLAITTVIATNLFDDAKENENRVDEGDGPDGGDISGLDG